MSRPALTLLLLTCAATALELPAQGSTRRRVRPFELHCDFKDDLFADDAVKVLGVVWTLAQKHFKPDAKMSRRRLKVFFYGARPAYEKAARRLKLSHLAPFQGFAHGRSLTCHILRHPAPGWNGAGMDMGNRHTLAHEATHLLVSLCCKNRGNFLPMWVNEGLPLWMEGEVMRVGGWAGKRIDNPQEAHGLRRSKSLLKQGSFPRLTELAAGRFGKLSAFDAYHPCRMLWWWLAEEYPAAIPELIETLRSSEASAALPDILASSLSRQIGELQDADGKLRAFLEGLPEPRLPAIPALPLDAVGKPGAADYRPGTPAVRWFGSTRRPAYRLETRVLIQPGGTAQADLVFGRWQQQWLRLSLVPGSGIYLQRRVDPAATWKDLIRVAEVPALVVGEELRLVLRVAKGRVRLALAGEEVLAHSVADLEVRGRFGVGGPRGARLRWRAPKLR